MGLKDLVIYSGWSDSTRYKGIYGKWRTLFVDGVFYGDYDHYITLIGESFWTFTDAKSKAVFTNCFGQEFMMSYEIINGSSVEFHDCTFQNNKLLIII